MKKHHTHRSHSFFVLVGEVILPFVVAFLIISAVGVFTIVIDNQLEIKRYEKGLVTEECLSYEKDVQQKGIAIVPGSGRIVKVFGRNWFYYLEEPFCEVELFNTHFDGFCID